MVWTVVRSKAVVLLFLGHCLLLLVLFGEGEGRGREGGVLSLFNNALLSVLSSFAIISQRKRELVAFLIMFLLSCGCVSSLWRREMVCGSLISWSYSIAF